MSQKFKVASAVAGVLASSLASNTTHGLTITSFQALNLSGSAAVGPSPQPASSSNTGVFTGAASTLSSTLGFAKFNATTGVLRSVTVALTGASGTGSATRSATISGSGLGAPATTTATRSVTGGANMGQVNINANGVVVSNTFGGAAIRTTAAQIAPSTAAGTWTYTNAPATVSGSGTLTPSGSQQLTLTTAQQNSFIGASGTADVASSMTVAAITKKNTSATNDFTQSAASATVNLGGAIRLTYDYVQHAEASFTDSGASVKVTTLDFGTVLVDAGGTPASKSVSVYNKLQAPSAADQNNLNIVSVSNPIHDGTLNFEPDGVLNNDMSADPGNSQTFTASFDVNPSNLGEHLEEYRIATADAGYETGNDSYNGVSDQLTVVMTGSVKDHAAPSFSATDPNKLTLDIDFNAPNGGKPYENQETVSQNFSVYNLLNGLLAGQRVDLRFLGCSSQTGDTASFDIAICGQTLPIDIAAGNSYSSLATFFAPGRGMRSATYQLQFRDYAPNLFGTPTDYSLTLNVKGVPEPETLALLGAGLLGFGVRRRGSRVA